MIKKFKGYDEITVFEGGAQIEPGGYELKIIGAKVEQFPNCEILKVAFDIINHETYAGFYKQKFESAKAQNPDAKWGGVFDVFIPKDDGSELDGKTKAAFKRFITTVERSSEGYVWNWDERTLKGKQFGGVFGREEFKTKDGQLKFATKCRFPRSIDKIRSGDFTIPEDKLLPEHDEYVDRMADKEAGFIGGMPDQFVPPLADAGNDPNFDSSGEFEEILSDGDLPF